MQYSTICTPQRKPPFRPLQRLEKREMQLLILVSSSQITLAKLLAGLLRSHGTAHTPPIVTSTLVYDSLTAPDSTDEIATIKDFGPDARLFFYTIRGLEDDVMVKHATGWDKITGPLPSVYVFEQASLWSPGNSSGKNWREYMLTSPDDNEQAKILEEFMKILRRCARAVQESKR